MRIYGQCPYQNQTKTIPVRRTVGIFKSKQKMVAWASDRYPSFTGVASGINRGICRGSVYLYSVLIIKALKHENTRTSTSERIAFML